MINQEEYEILKDLDDRLGWLARDRDGDLVAYEKKPEKSTRFWFDNGRMVNLGVIFDVGRLFQFIQWEDEEPYRISDLIKEYEIKGLWLAPSGRDIVDALSGSEETEVKKDIEWLKGRFRGRKIFKPQNDREIGYNMAIDEFSEYVDQLDEPEVLSQELPVIPKYVADWIEDRKEMGFPIYQAIRVVREDSRFEHSHLREWLWTNKGQEVFARAWLDGYKIEEEPKFYVLDKEDRPLLLRFSQGIMRAPSGLSPIDKIVKNQRNSVQFTEQEIKDCDERLWAFAVPVEEVEDER